MGVGQPDMFLHDDPQFRERHPLQGGTEGRHGGESPDVFVTDSAPSGFLALGIAGEEGPVVFLDVGVAMPSRLEHAGDVALEPGVGIIAAALPHERKEFPCQLKIECILARLEELVVVNPPLAPVARLIPQDVPLLIEGIILGTPEDAPGVRVFRLKEAIHGAVLPSKGPRVVVPVNRHGQRIGGKGAQEGLFPTIAGLPGHDTILMADL